MSKWSSRFHWVKRVEAWDDERDRVARAQRIESIREAVARHVRESRLIQNIGVSRLAQEGTADTLPATEAKTFIMDGVDLERRSLGLREGGEITVETPNARVQVREADARNDDLVREAMDIVLSEIGRNEST